ncbi:DUF7544 domain-containing protein [Halosolutus gelatinilyticus]|uniref:DUF7544 domain-containing protein n=1 Tax=Halosolutus gelatinilyticus TaxID=2931975 RepID=UPI001FF0EEFE|nr:hypothetical protein [Halosolutus gelatinilyticus]
MYASSNLGNALSVTRRYFGSLGGRGWLKLGVVVFLLGGLGLSSHLLNASLEPIWDVFDDPTGATTELALLAVGLGVVIGFAYVSAVLEFVFVDSLRTEAVRFRRDLRANCRRGCWLLLFRLSLALSAIAVVAIAVAAVVYAGDIAAPDELSAGEIAVIAFVAAAAFVGWHAVDTLTTAFVVPIMLLDDRGPIGGWRAFAGAMRSNPWGAVGFLVVAWTIGSTLWLVITGIGFVATIFGVLLFAVAALGLTAVDQSLGWVAVVALLVASLAYQYGVALAAAPVRAYVRYYALLILGDTTDALDPIPEQRAAVRADAGSVADRRDRLDRAGTARSADAGERNAIDDGTDESASWAGPRSWDGRASEEPRSRDEPTAAERRDRNDGSDSPDEASDREGASDDEQRDEGS